MGTIISGFPGVGKSFIFNISKQLNLKVIDSDSSSYSHITVKQYDEYVRIPNPDFPSNYINTIRSYMCSDDIDIIMISTHEEVRNALIKEAIPFMIVYPDKKFKNEYDRA